LTTAECEKDLPTGWNLTRARIHKQNEKTAKKISFPKVNFSNGIHKHWAKRYLFTTGEKKKKEDRMRCGK
jgi:hypothetical protein